MTINDCMFILELGINANGYDSMKISYLHYGRVYVKNCTTRDF
jgi:hypothetical protein